MTLEQIIMRLLDFAKTEILPVIPGEAKGAATAIAVRNAGRLKEAAQMLLPVAQSITFSDEDIEKLIRAIKGE